MREAFEGSKTKKEVEELLFLAEAKLWREAKLEQCKMQVVNNAKEVSPRWERFQSKCCWEERQCWHVLAGYCVPAPTLPALQNTILH